MFVVKAWKGKEPLWRVFWLYGVLISALVTAVFLWLVATDAGSFGLRQLLLIAFVPYTAWILVSIWRCALNVRNETYGHLARWLTVAWALNTTFLVISAELDMVL